MGLFSKFFSGLQKTQSKLSGELKRIVSRSPKFTEDDAEELEAVLLASDMGFAVTEEIVDAVREKYQTGGGQAGDVLQVAVGHKICQFKNGSEIWIGGQEAVIRHWDDFDAIVNCTDNIWYDVPEHCHFVRVPFNNRLTGYQPNLLTQVGIGITRVLPLLQGTL